MSTRKSLFICKIPECSPPLIISQLPGVQRKYLQLPVKPSPRIRKKEILGQKKRMENGDGNKVTGPGRMREAEAKNEEQAKQVCKSRESSSQRPSALRSSPALPLVPSVGS